MLGKFQHIPMLGNNFSHLRKTRKQSWPSGNFVIIPFFILMSFFRFSMIFILMNPAVHMLACSFRRYYLRPQNHFAYLVEAELFRRWVYL